MKKSVVLFFVFASLLVACSSGAQSSKSQNGIEVSRARVLLPAGDAMNGMDSTLAGFMTIKNSSPDADRLTGVSVDFAEASLHQTSMEGDVMKMNEIKDLELPAGATVELKSGGYHIMFMNLTRQVKVGDTVDLVLQFEKAGKITIPVKVTDK